MYGSMACFFLGQNSGWKARATGECNEWKRGAEQRGDKMMVYKVAGVMLVCLVGLSADCSAQGLFGQRSVGGSISNRNERLAGRAAAGGGGSQGGSGSGSGAATASQSAVPQRFLREERQSGGFVGGSTAADAAADFVGREGTAEAAVGSAIGMTEARPPVNRPRIPRVTGLYSERLRPASELNSAATTLRARRSSAVSGSVTDYLQSAGMSVEVSSAEQSAIVRGAVPSAEDRQKIELLLLLEPGIQSVQNQLTIDPQAPRPSRKPPARLRDP